MIHPSTTLKAAQEDIGSGVFATDFIPQGTIVVVRDPWDLSFTEEEFAAIPETIRNSMENYAYHDREGKLVLSWDHAKYMNHNCHSNTMMTAYGLEIAVRDINKGDEITSEYGLLNVQEPYDLTCGCVNCRKRLSLDDIDLYAEEWDRQIKESLRLSFSLPQPLKAILSEASNTALEMFLKKESSYKSVRTLKWRRA